MSVRFSRREMTFVPMWRGNNDLPEDQQIKVVHRALTAGDIFKLQRETKTNVLAGTPDLANAEEVEKYWNVLRYFFKNHITAIHGIFIDDVEITSPEEVCDTALAGMLDLLMEIYAGVISSSSPEREERGNSALEPEPANSDSSTTVSPVPPMNSESEIAAAST